MKIRFKFFLACFFVLSSCKWGDIQKSFNPDRKNIICLIDFSGSIKKKKMKDYADGISNILRAMGPEDKLVVYPIDEASLTDRITMFYEDFKNADHYSGTTFKDLNLPDSVGPPFKRQGEDDFSAYNKMPARISNYLKYIYPKILSRIDSIRQDRIDYSGKSDLFSAIYSVKDDVVKTEDNSIANIADKKTKNILIILVTIYKINPNIFV